MGRILQLEDLLIEEVDRNGEINYVIKDNDGYICTLVPGYAGFELSAKDKNLDIDPGESLVTRLSEFIVTQHG